MQAMPVQWAKENLLWHAARLYCISPGTCHKVEMAPSNLWMLTAMELATNYDMGMWK